MNIIAIVLENLVKGVSIIKNILTTDLSQYLGGLGNILNAVGISLNGITLIGILSGAGLIVLLIYSIIK